MNISIAHIVATWGTFKDVIEAKPNQSEMFAFYGDSRITIGPIAQIGPVSFIVRNTPAGNMNVKGEKLILGSKPEFGLVKIAPGVWTLSNSIVVTDAVHAFVVLRGVPEPAPWETAKELDRISL